MGFLQWGNRAIWETKRLFLWYIWRGLLPLDSSFQFFCVSFFHILSFNFSSILIFHPPPLFSRIFLFFIFYLLFSNRFTELQELCFIILLYYYKWVNDFSKKRLFLRYIWRGLDVGFSFLFLGSEHMRWRHHWIRLFKIAWSLELFGETERYNSLHTYCRYLESKGVTLTKQARQVFRQRMWEW